MSDFHVLSGAYALDALDDIERAQFQRHLETCDICQQEVDSFGEAAAVLSELTAVTPPPALRELVLAGIAAVRPLPPAVAAPTMRGPRRRTTTFLAAAAAAVILGGGVFTAQQVTRDEPSQVEVIMAASDAQSVTKKLPNGARATLVRSADLDKAVVITKAMAPAPEGYEYVVWLKHDDVMVQAGIMPPGAENTVVLAGDPAAATGAGITVEKVGVPHTEPQGETLALFDFGQA